MVKLIALKSIVRRLSIHNLDFAQRIIAANSIHTHFDESS